jgi:2-polyprenyl-6-methoxyphenol hydroxylase-like FAD-dependent oxidoreductase
MTRPFDVCVRGGGITGRTLALLLAKERLRVGLLVQETAPFASDVQADVRAYALNQKSRQLLESVRCWPGEPYATAVRAMQVRGDDGGQVTFRADDTPSGALAWIVDVPALEALLAQASRYAPQIELLTAPASATLTVVCEGKASATRAEFGIDFEVTPYPQHAIAARLQCQTPHGHVAHQWFSHGEILGLLPLGGAAPEANEVALVWSLAPERADALLDMPPDDFARALQVASHDSLGALTLCSERTRWPLQLARAAQWVGQSGGQAWALAGDAAHTVHPLSGQGLNLGLADVAELATLIAQRDYWRSVADERLLRRYERARKAEAALLAGTTDGLQRLFAQPGSPWPALRNWGLDAFERSGPLKHWVTRRAMGA